jgi:O-antigen biosynthesis protein
MNRRPAVTLLLPNRNNDHVLDLAFERLLQHTTYPDYELIVVDDGSDDDSVEILRRWQRSGKFPELSVIEREHSGVVETLNAGLAAASGELVVQLDGDATLETPGWLERMVDFYESDPLVGIVTPRIVFDTGILQAAGVNMISPEGLHDRGARPDEPTGRRTFNSRVERMTPEHAGKIASEPAEVDLAIGVCMLYPLSLAESVGGYDANFSPVWFDDLDLALNSRRLGAKTFFLPDVEVRHRMTMRKERTPPPESRVGRFRKGARRTVARAFPDSVRRAVRRIEWGNPRHPPHEVRRLRHHYGYWEEKWGFHPINPDLDQILERYGDTEICWAYDDARRASGQRVVAAWKEQSRPSSEVGAGPS